MSLFLLMAFAFVFSASKTPLLFSWSGVSAEVKEVTKYIDRQDRKYWTEDHQWLLDNATREELLALKEYPNGHIKLIAHLGLIERNPQRAFLIAKEALLIKDILYPGTIHDCMGVKPRPTGAYLYECLLGKTFSMPHPVLKDNILSKLSKEELDTLKNIYRNCYKPTDPYAAWREKFEK